MSDTTTHNDHQIRSAVLKCLDWTPGLRTEQIGVAVTDGALTLSGEVDSANAKSAALQAATGVAGVTAIADEIVVRQPGTVHDADVAREVQRLLRGVAGLNVGAVTATVHRLTVMVTGQVDDRELQQRVLECVEAVPRVERVVDRLEVLRVPAAAEVRSQVATALARGASAEAEYLDVDVDGHVAVLRGTVHSSYERRAAEQTALAVPGINAVRNELTVYG